jgi:predicted kinase
MSKEKATLFLLCGKIAAGKSMLAMKLATEPGTILISEDQWLGRLEYNRRRRAGDLGYSIDARLTHSRGS